MFKLIHYSRSGEEIFEFNTEAELKAELKKIKHLNQKFEVDKELAEDGTLDYIAITTNPLLFKDRRNFNFVLKMWSKHDF